MYFRKCASLQWNYGGFRVTNQVPGEGDLGPPFAVEENKRDAPMEDSCVEFLGNVLIILHSVLPSCPDRSEEEK